MAGFHRQTLMKTHAVGCILIGIAAVNSVRNRFHDDGVSRDHVGGRLRLVDKGFRGKGIAAVDADGQIGGVASAGRVVARVQERHD